MDPELETRIQSDGEEGLTPILATTSVLFYVRGEPYTDNEEASGFINALTEKLQGAVKAAFEGESSVEVIGAVGFRYPKEEESNIVRCAKCGQWLTNEDQLNPCDGLMPARLVNGEYLCDQHHEMAILSGAIPRPEGFWTSLDGNA